jgi:hypothetical protein
MSLHARNNHGPRVVQIDLQRRHIENPVAHDRLRRRKNTVGVTLDNLVSDYPDALTKGRLCANHTLHRKHSITSMRQ